MMRLQTGVALITVLLILALATVAVVSLSTERQMDIRRMDNQLRNTEAWSHVQGIERWAMQRLRDGAKGGQTLKLATGTATLTARIDDLQNRLNINNLIVDGEVSKPDVARLKRLMGFVKADAAVLDSVLDWLDADSDPRGKQGAEDDFYSKQQPPYRAANRNVTDLSELLLLNGMTRETYDKLAPYLVAIDGYAPVNVNTAEAMVLRCLADDISADRAASITRASGKPFKALDDFFADEAVTGSGIDKYGLTVGSLHYVVTGAVDMGRVRLAFESYLDKGKDDKIDVVRRIRTGWQHD
ncbi:MAG: type II secretion system minor pseudopilin GspK [Methylomonas sp.]|nr:type II secretion system minor pseudopilin GspK [Methylomonas sp.]PPD24756.1 MAG: general secretion pathway protein GspK [Methylomonas sp.]PPD33357.1 MAG: general secretion pathway protein GspK [Methylomonas sp.]